MTRTVTAGLDGSPESLAAAHWAAHEAVLRGVALHLVHAEEFPTTAAIPMAYEGAQRRWADSLLRETADNLRVRHPGLEITTLRLPGRPSAALPIEAASSDMLVLGSRGLSGIMGFLLGSVGMATISATEQPVILVRAGEGQDEPVGPFRDLVVGVDIYRSCDRLLAFAFEEAAQRGCTLRVLHAWNFPLMLSYAPLLEPDIQVSVGRQVARSLSDMLIPWRQKFPSVNVVEKSVVGPPAQQLLYASGDADLVVVGRHIRHRPLGAHIGHVAHAVIHHAAAPVAVVAHD